MKTHMRMLTMGVLAVGFVGFSASCSRESGASPPTPAVKIEEAHPRNVVEVDDAEQFALVTVEQRRAFAELKVNGVVSPDVNRTVPVLSLSGGRVVEIRAKLGDDVQKGQVLLRINSTDLAMAFSEYQKFKTTEELTRLQLERSRLLYSKGAIATKDLEVANEVEETVKIDLATATERLHILGADVNHPSPIIAVKAPISGTIVEQNVTGGTGVKSLDSSPNLFTIADLSRVWVLCDVYENNLAQVHLGDFADVRLNAYPDKVSRGRVGNISRVLDPATRTAKVRLELDNPDRRMRIGMFATATFRPQTAQLRLVVPATAVIRLHDKDWVFRPENGHRFLRTEIQTGAVRSDGLQEVLSGLSAGDKVVANALQFSSGANAE